MTRGIGDQAGSGKEREQVGGNEQSVDHDWLKLFVYVGGMPVMLVTMNSKTAVMNDEHVHDGLVITSPCHENKAINTPETINPKAKSNPPPPTLH